MAKETLLLVGSMLVWLAAASYLLSTKGMISQSVSATFITLAAGIAILAIIVWIRSNNHLRPKH